MRRSSCLAARLRADRPSQPRMRVFKFSSEEEDSFDPQRGRGCEMRRRLRGGGARSSALSLSLACWCESPVATAGWPCIRHGNQELGGAACYLTWLPGSSCASRRAAEPQPRCDLLFGCVRLGANSCNVCVSVCACALPNKHRTDANSLFNCHCLQAILQSALAFMPWFNV